MNLRYAPKGAVRPWSRQSIALTAIALSSLLWACAPIPPPDVLAELDRVRQVPASLEAKKLAPQSFQQAESLRAEADRALEDGDFAGAQIIGERALAAYTRATVLARVVRAEQVRVAARADADAARQALVELDAEHQKVAADIAALQLRLKVLRSAEPTVPCAAATIAREKARRQVVRGLRLQAGLLCIAGRLLADKRAQQANYTPPKQLATAQRELAVLAGLLDGDPAAAPIDQARRVRAGCLGALTALQSRGQSPLAGANTDVLVTDLSTAGYAVSREDHGVVVTLRGLFQANAVSAQGKQKVAKLVPVMRKHGRFPWFIVLHQSKRVPPAELARWQERGRDLARVLGVPKAETEIVENALPVVDPQGQYKQRNERTDIVFVSPYGI